MSIYVVALLLYVSRESFAVSAKKGVSLHKSKHEIQSTPVHIHPSASEKYKSPSSVCIAGNIKPLPGEDVVLYHSPVSLFHSHPLSLKSLFILHLQALTLNTQSVLDINILNCFTEIS